jgi:hypothetical protein
MDAPSGAGGLHARVGDHHPDHDQHGPVWDALEGAESSAALAAFHREYGSLPLAGIKEAGPGWEGCYS